MPGWLSTLSTSPWPPEPRCSPTRRELSGISAGSLALAIEPDADGASVVTVGLRPKAHLPVELRQGRSAALPPVGKLLADGRDVLKRLAQTVGAEHEHVAGVKRGCSHLAGLGTGRQGIGAGAENVVLIGGLLGRGD